MDEVVDAGITMVDESENKLERTKVKRLNMLWLNIQPQKNDFSSLINETF